MPSQLRVLMVLLALTCPVLAASLTTPDGGAYEGDVKNGLLHGNGRIDWPDGTYYSGAFRNGLKHGEGTQSLLDGRIYQGQYKNGQWVDGVLHFPNGQTYDGDFVRQRFEGKGTLTFGNRTVYEGEFRAGKMEGEGRMSTADSTVYEGTFNADRLTRGTITANDGSVYQGELSNWRPHGEGRLVEADGEVVEGQFAYGDYVGENGLPAYQEQQVRQQERLERALYNQRALADDQLSRLRDQTAGEPEVFALLAALSNSETVFRTEVETIDAQLTAMPQFDGRLVTLANELRDNDNYPLATSTSLRHIVRSLGTRLGDEDLIFVYLTSHGSPDHELSVDFNANQALPGIDPTELASILDEAPQQKVVVISACYSGGFLSQLGTEDMLVITAAAADKPSFGCSNEETMTYFGRAFFETAFTLEKPLDEVFEDARAAVTERELAREYDPSNPQIRVAEPVLQAWDRWRTQLNNRLN
ncbi:C13 family peptidase [Saccharospirillum impatiens]|uniref:C13 family peptidase n=1 Tax=Saccharospirillum impatiens TaxID=169438 RepID=UPI0004040856|nr:C13 family peptidase [Saccharospirillum impatiens]